MDCLGFSLLTSARVDPAKMRILGEEWPIGIKVDGSFYRSVENEELE